MERHRDNIHAGMKKSEKEKEDEREEEEAEAYQR